MNAMTTTSNWTKGILIVFCISFSFLVIEFLIIEQIVLAGFMIVGLIISILITLCGYAKDKRDENAHQKP